MAVIENRELKNGFAITASDTVDIKDDIANFYSVGAVRLHNVAAGATVRVMPAFETAPKGYTLTGSSGTANITINGTAYLATYSSSLTVTASNFVTLWATTLAGLGIIVKSTGAQLRFTGAVGSTFSIANVSGTLSGTALADTPITIFVAQGDTHPLWVRRVYATTPAPPVGLIGLFNK